jgi:serine protein kinase
MIDRIFVVKVPYNLRLSQEIRIYEKLIGQSQLSDDRVDLMSVHIAPTPCASPPCSRS